MVYLRSQLYDEVIDEMVNLHEPSINNILCSLISLNGLNNTSALI